MERLLERCCALDVHKASVTACVRLRDRRLRRRRGDKQAIVAVAHSILVIAYHLLKDGDSYHDLGGDFSLRRKRPHLLARRLVPQLEGLGHRVTLEPLAA